jgi:enoyl-[acyl-carrier protein] reductase I
LQKKESGVILAILANKEKEMKLLEGKKALIFGIANDKSIAYGIARKLKEHGADIGISYASQVLEKRVTPLAGELGASFCEMCDLADSDAVDALFNVVEREFGKFDILVHSVAYASREALTGRFIDTAKDDFLTAMNISVYSLIQLARKSEPLLNDDSSVITLTYFGGEKVVQNYNIMGVAKSALDSAVRYLSVDLGARGIRVNAISPGPIKTLAVSGIGGFRSIFPVIESLSPLHRAVNIDDCGGAAVYLASELGKNVTGEILHVDSGFNIIGIREQTPVKPQ